MDFVKTQKKIVQSNSGKFLSDKYYNYVAFKDKQRHEYLQRLLDTAMKTKVDIGTESVVLRDWIRTYERITKQNEDETLYKENNFEKIKQIYKSIYLSPLDFGDLFFEVGKRIEIAN